MTTSKRFVTVAGATGFVGRSFVERLARENKYRIRCLVRRGLAMQELGMSHTPLETDLAESISEIRAAACHAMHRVTRAIVASSSLLVMHSGHAGDTVVQVVGEAYDLNSANHLYSETHCVSGDALTRKVIYHNADDELIAHKILNYETGPTTPSYVQHNVRGGESIAVELRRDDIAITIRDQSDSGPGKTVTARLDASVPLVIDAGFDAFVRDNWDSLVAGESQRFQFPFAARETLVELRIESASCSYDAASDQCFSLEPNNWLLSKLSAPIELGYDAQRKRLARFRGVSNIDDANGGGQVVDIRYRYHGVAGAVCDMANLPWAEHTADRGSPLPGDDW